MSDDSLYVVHGGSDFDKINPSRFGSGEPGNIRPLGKGLYSFVIDHEDPKRAAYAIDYAKHYSKKYGYGDKAVHVFKIPKSISTSWNGDNDDNTKFPRYPRKIEGLGGYPEKELAEYRAIDDKYKAVKGTPEEGDSWLYSNRAYERLKQAADVQFQHLPIGLTEASIHNPEVATRIGKFDLDTPTEDILGMVKNDVANVPHKDNGGSVGHIENHSSAIAEAMQNHFGVPVSVSKSKTPYGESHYVKPQFDLPKGETPFNIRVSDHGAWVPRLHQIEHQVYPKKGDDPEKFVDESINAAKKYGQRIGIFPKDEFVPLKGEVYHHTFGKGTIVNSQPDVAKVDFGDKGVKNISSRFLQEVPHKDNGGGITAYQGGPHSVGEEGFLDEKIGTGEGAQAYGHGHYFAEAEPIAKYYRDKLTDGQEKVMFPYGDGEKYLPDEIDDPTARAAAKALLTYSSSKGYKEYLRRNLEPEPAVAAMKLIKNKDIVKTPAGSMHEVSINAHPDHFLDWDKSLSEQSEHVQNAIYSHSQFNNYVKKIMEKELPNMDGKTIQRLMLGYKADLIGSPKGADAAASNEFSNMGIHGIKYLDASSRSKGEGTRNYVVFDPKRIDVKRRYKDGGEVDDGGITAYHSSPHDFDEFDTAKIGTGEGNQMYGHGLYFAENPEVSGQGGQYYNQFMNKMKSSPERHATAALWANKFDRDKAIASLDRSHAYHSDQAIPGRYANGPDAEEGDRLLAEEYKEGADYLRSGKIAGPRTYEVSINAHQDHMLDWDKTIDEQSDYIKNALNKTEWWPWTKERIEDRAGRHGANPQGRHVYNDLSEDYSLEEATNFLQDAGIKGVRYLDAGSRDSGKGTHNYVVFDHKNVNVKRKYKDGGEVDDGITAYHGSPHDFDQFDMAKIGKGVGEQAYGHGLYFTGHEPTAIDFRDRATASKNINDFNLYRISGSNEEFEPQKQGHMYEVNISAHPDHMLDWNKPLSEQSPYIVKSIFDARKDNPTLFNVFKSHFEKDSTGMDFYQALATQHPNGYQGASEFLQRSGVHGVKYRDENSRDKGKGTTNYVVFDPKNVDVKRKYEQGGEVLPHDDPQREKNLAAFQEGNHPDVPHVLYHGTKRNFDTFNLNAPPAGDSGVQMLENRAHTDVGFFGKGFYFAGPNAASAWSEYGKPEEGVGSNVMPVHLSMKNPFIVTHPDSSSGAMAMQHSLARLGHGHITSPTAQTELLKKLGHDGVIAARTEDGKTTPYEWVAFHPHQIKSATGNNGDFNPSKPNINEARGGRIGYDYGGDVRTGDNPGSAADANRSAVTSRDADRNYHAGSGTQTAGPSSNNRPDNRPDNSNDRFNIGGGGAPTPPQRGDDSFFGNMGGNIGSVLGGLAFGPLGSIGGRYLGNQFNQPDNSRFEAKNDEFGNPIGNSGGWLDFLGNSGTPPAPMTSDNRRDPIIKPIKRKRRILMPDGTYQEVEEDMKSGGVAKSYNRVHNSKIVEHALSKVGVSLHTRRPPS